MADVNGGRASRRERAALTRRRIRDAARDLFAEHGYAGTTMEAVAAHAGVAVQTVYFVFHTKSELLQAVLEAAVLGDATPVPPHRTTWWSAMAASDDPRAAVRHLVGGVGGILARVAPLLPTFAGAANEPAVAGTWERSQELRHDGYADVVAVLDDRFGLREGLDRREGTDVLFTLLGPDVYRQLVIGRGWTHERWTRWAEELLVRELLGGD